MLESTLLEHRVIYASWLKLAFFPSFFSNMVAVSKLLMLLVSCVCVCVLGACVLCGLAVEQPIPYDVFSFAPNACAQKASHVVGVLLVAAQDFP
eukprot:599946-Amphidinium_carterae.1